MHVDDENFLDDPLASLLSKHKKESYHPFQNSHDSILDAKVSVSISESTLINATKFAGIAWTYEFLHSLGSDPYDIPNIAVDPDDDRICRASRPINDDVRGCFSFFLTFNPSTKHYRVHVFCFSFLDRYGREIGDDELIIKGSTVELNRKTKTVWVNIKEGTRLFAKGKLVSGMMNGGKALVNVVAEAVKKSGKSEIVNITNEAVKHAIKSMSELITGGPLQ